MQAKYSLIVPNVVSSVYLAIMDNSQNMALAISDMSISDNISVEFMESREQILENSAAIVFDTCLSTGVMDYILTKFTDKPIYVDPVSVGKSKAIKNLTDKIHTLKMKKLEAEFLSNTKIEGISGLEKTSEWFLNRGVKRVFITLGKDGVFYRDSETTESFKPSEADIKNATGAGDALMAVLMALILKRISALHRVFRWKH